MSREIIEAWTKDDAFKFWDTVDGKPVTNKANVLYGQKFQNRRKCLHFICQKFLSVCNKENKVTKECKTWYRNYLLRHNDIKHNVEI